MILNAKFGFKFKSYGIRRAIIKNRKISADAFRCRICCRKHSQIFNTSMNY